MSLNPLYRLLNYEFKDLPLIHQALTHRSVGAKNNERLEFLGDSVLNLAITSLLIKQYPDYPEGRLSRMRAYLVKEDTLGQIASQLKLGDYLKLGQGELRSGGHRRKSILADALEAILGAVYLEAGFEVSKDVVQHLYQDMWSSDLLEERMCDHKSVLQEKLQALKKNLPTYTLTRMTGESHEQVFHVICTVKGLEHQGNGQGTTRRQAEHFPFNPSFHEVLIPRANPLSQINYRINRNLKS